MLPQADGEWAAGHPAWAVALSDKGLLLLIILMNI